MLALIVTVEPDVYVPLPIPLTTVNANGAAGTGAVLVGMTVTVTADEVAEAPALLVTIALSEYEPAVTFAHKAVYGALVLVPITVEPE